MEKLSNKVVTSYRVVGAKAGDKPREPKIAKDSVASISTAKILYGLNDGEISGIVGNAKGIKLNDTPLEDDSGNKNFEGVKWDFRAGTIDQAYIEGFPSISNEIPVSVELKSTSAWVKAISNPTLSAVRVRFSWNGLRKQDTKNGDVSGYKIEYAIDIKTTSGAYVEVLKTKIEDKVTGKYERTHRLELPKSANGWQIRVRRLTPNANLDNIQDKMFIESITEVIDQKFTYPHTTLLGLQYDAKTFSSIAKLAVRAKGKLIKIPTNYDSVSNTYSGVWNGQFKLEYSNNPAWIFYDLVLSNRYGLGRRIDASMVDKWALYSIAMYCDELVDDGEGGLEKRYTCNVYLQSQDQAFNVLSQLAGIFRGLTYWSGQQLVLSADVPKEPSYTFSRANVIDGNFEYSGTALNDRHTVAKVAWDNPNENFKTEYEIIRDEEAISQFGINELTISAIGCTSRGQAQRAGLWALKSEQLETEVVSFRTGLEGSNVVVGEVIEVSDEQLAGRANGGRIVAVSSDLKSITIDRDAVAKVNDFVSVNGKDGTSQRRKVIAVSGRVLTVLTPYIDIDTGSVWAISSTDLNTMLFRVLSVKPDEDHIHTITAIQHEPLKYNAIDTGADVKPTNISILKPTNVEAPSSVSVSANYKLVQAQTVATLVIQWSQVKEAVSYSVEWRRNSGNWIKIPNTGNVSAEVEGVYAGDYEVRVKSINAFDVESNFITSAITSIAGKVGNPKALASIKATGLLFGMAISWSFQAGSEDTNYTEIQTATDASGANTATLGSFSYPTDKTELTGLQGGLTVFYRGRIIDKLGNVSAWSAWVSGTTDASADKVLDLLTGQITESQLYKDLSDKIGEIDTNKTILDDLSIDLTELDIGLVQANTEIGKANTKIAESKALIDANKLDLTTAKADIVKAKSDIVNNNTTLTTELNTAKTDISKAKSDILATNSTLNTAKADIVTAKGVADSAKADAAANKTTLTALSTTVGNNKTSVDSSITTLTNKDTALTNLYTALKSEYDTNKASVTSDITTLTNKDTALANSITTLTSTVSGNTSAISTNNAALVAKDKAIADSVTALDTDYKGNKASVAASLSTLSTKDTALTNSITTLTTSVGANTASIGSINTALSTANEAIASNKTEINAKFDAIQVGGRNLLKGSGIAVNTSDYVMGTYDFTDTIKAGEEVTITIWGTLAEGKTGFAMYNSGGTGGFGYPDLIKEGVYQKTFKWREVGTNTYFKIYQAPSSVTGNSIINKVKLERGNKGTDWTPAPEDTDTALALTNAAISSEAVTRANADSAITSTVNTLRSEYDTNKASVTSSLSTLTSKDTALTNSITALTSTVSGNTATISSNNSTLVTKTNALSTAIDSINAEYATNKANVTRDLTALANKDTAIVTDINSLKTKTDLSNAEIVKTNTAIANTNTSLANTNTNIITKFNEAKTYTDIKSSILVIDSKTKKFFNPVNYSSASSSVTGYLVIETPITPSRMCSIKIGGYNYNNTQNTIGLTVGFYNTTSFVNTGYESFGSFKISSVQLAKKDEDKKAVLIIGLSNTVWSYPKIVVEEALVGYTASPDSYIEGWNVSIKTDISEYANLSTVNGVDIQNTLIESNAAITAEATARSSADNAITSTVNSLKSEYDTNKASVTSSLSTLTSKDVALTNSLNALDSDYKGNKATVTSSLATLTNKDVALTNSLNSLTSTVGNNTTAITNEATTRASADSALSSRISTNLSKANDALSRITTAESTIASNTQAIASTKTELKADFNNLQIGGRNLLKDSGMGVTTSLYNIADYPLVESIAEGELVTCTLWGTLGAGKSYFALYNSGGSGGKRLEEISTGVYQATFNWSVYNTNSYAKLYHISSSVTATSTVNRIKLERGNKGTDWSEADTSGYDEANKNKNLYDVTKATRGNYVLESDGVIRATGIHTVSDYIEVKPNTNYTFSMDSEFGSFTYLRYVFFDMYKNYISGVRYDSGNSVTVTTPDKCKYIMFSSESRQDQYTKWVLALGNTAIKWTPSPNAVGALLIEEATTRATTDTALSNLYTALNSEYNSNKASVSSSLSTLTNKDTALTNSLNTLTSKVNTNTADITTEESTRASADTALSNRITTAQSKADSAFSKITTAESTIASNTQAIAQTRSDLIASYTVQDTRNTDELPSYYYTNFPKQIVNEFKRNAVLVGVVGAGTYVALETNVKWGDASGGSIIQTAITDDNRVYIRTSASNTAWKAWLEQEDVVGSAAKVAAAKAALDGRINTTDARITSEAKTSADADKALGVRIDTVTATANTNKAAIQTEVTARANAVSSLASTVNTLQTVVRDTTTINNWSMRYDWSNWTNYVGDGELTTSSANGMVIGNNSGDDQQWLIRNDNIPIINGAIYRISCRYRNAAGTGTTYLGVAGVASNGTTLVNTSGSDSYGGQHYVATDALQGGWKILTGYIAASDADVSKIAGAVKLHTSASYFRPLLIANYSRTAGTTCFDWVKIELVDRESIASIEEAKTSIDGLSAQTTLKLDVNGYVSGMGQYNNGTTSQFAVRADQFYIANPSANTKSIPFQVTTSTTTVNGVSVPAGTYIADAYIKNGSIDNAKIGNAAITNAKIGNAAITTAKIGNAQVDTLQIAGQAVSITAMVDKTIRGNGIDLNPLVPTGGSTVTLPVSLNAGSNAVVMSFTLYSLEFIGRQDRGVWIEFRVNGSPFKGFYSASNTKELTATFTAQCTLTKSYEQDFDVIITADPDIYVKAGYYSLLVQTLKR